MQSTSEGPAAQDADRAGDVLSSPASNSAHVPQSLNQDQAHLLAPGGVEAARAELLRDFIFEALAPVEHDSAAARLSLHNDDDAGARYHLERVVKCVKAAAATFNELDRLTKARAA